MTFPLSEEHLVASRSSDSTRRYSQDVGAHDPGEERFISTSSLNNAAFLNVFEN